jgi:hypothetical protein
LQACEIFGTVGILEVQFRLQPAIPDTSSRTEVPQFLPFINSGGVVDPLGLHQGGLLEVSLEVVSTIARKGLLPDRGELSSNPITRRWGVSQYVLVQEEL